LNQVINTQDESIFNNNSPRLDLERFAIES